MFGDYFEIEEVVFIVKALILVLSADLVMEYEKNGNYNPRDEYYNNQDVRQVKTQIVN